MIKQCISRNWQFKITKAYHRFHADPTPYQQIDLPHDYAVTQVRTPDEKGTTGNGFFPDERGRYVKYLTFAPGKHYTLDLDGAYMLAQVSLNENHLALHPYGYTPFLVELTPCILPGITNNLVINTNPLFHSTRQRLLREPER